jgi:hypothetical protein
VPVKAVPSLQVAVTVFVSCAWIAPMGRKSPAISAKDSSELRIRPLLMNDAGHQYQPQGILYATDLYLARAAHRLVLLMTKSTSCPAHLKQTSPAGQ